MEKEMEKEKKNSHDGKLQFDERVYLNPKKGKKCQIF